MGHYNAETGEGGWTPVDPLSAFVGCPVHNIIFGPRFMPNGAFALASVDLRSLPRLDSVSVLPLTRNQTRFCGE